jgi:hypothetical protein
MPDPTPEPVRPVPQGFANTVAGDVGASAKPRPRKTKNEQVRELIEQQQLAEKLRTAELENDRRQVELEQNQAAHDLKLQQLGDAHDQIIALRKQFGFWVLVVVVAWKFLVLGLLAFVGTKLLILPDSVLLALVTTTTANILGLLVIVLKFVFPIPDLTTG